jgi:hypothetical protein
MRDWCLDMRIVETMDNCQHHVMVVAAVVGQKCVDLMTYALLNQFKMSWSALRWS